MKNRKVIHNYLPELFYLLLKRSKPSAVTINITRRCNQKCIYCEIGNNIPSTNEGELTQDDLIWIIDQMAENHIKRLALCGGEPFLYEPIIELIEYAGNKGIQCSITTNGMNAYFLEDKQMQILKKHNAIVNISIDSFNENTQQTTRGQEKALENAIRSISHFQKYYITLNILTAISKYNFTEIVNLVETANAMGVYQVLFQPIISFSNYPDRPVLKEKAQLNVATSDIPLLLGELQKIWKFEKKNRIRTNVYRLLPWIESYIITANGQNKDFFFDRILNHFYCRDIYAIIDISYDGGIQPCGLSVAKIHIQNNKEKGLINLWLEATKQIKQDITTGEFHPYCNGCCHHFSRNMLASVMKYPIKNRKALIILAPILLSRAYYNALKKLKTDL